jgi:sugar O-acyltransferase (sialic acid O-acetyltransferase NeuD family)
MKRILLFGSSGHASVITNLVEKQGTWEIAGYYDPLSSAERVMGYEVLGRNESLPAVLRRTEAASGIVAIGDNAIRERVVNEIIAEVQEFDFVSAIHPSAQIARECHIDKGTVIMAGAVINSRARIGRHCIVNTRASVDHDCTMDDFSSLGPNATLAGTIVVLNDMPAYVVAHGVPARISLNRVAAEPYLRRKVKRPDERLRSGD